MRQQRMVMTRLLVLAAIGVVAPKFACGQALPLPEEKITRGSAALVLEVCKGTAGASLPKNDLQQPVQNRKESDEAILQKCAPMQGSEIPKVIVVGFVGGFIKQDDVKHPEVQFAMHLRDRYSSRIYAEVFGNHSQQEALRQILLLVDTNRDGTLSAAEKQRAKIIIYGHSWGASATVALARDLERRGIPVLLAILVDAIAKPGEKDSTIPSNVASAVNFYQSRGILHGHSKILAADPTRTTIIGNFEMTYKDHPINCDNYRWYARVFTKSHVEIENDPRVWDQAASLIDAELSGIRPTSETSLSYRAVSSK